VAGTDRNNFMFGHVMTMSEHIWSGQVRSDQSSDKSRRSCQVSTGQVSSGQDHVRSSHVKSCQLRSSQVMSDQYKSGQVRSC